MYHCRDNPRPSAAPGPTPRASPGGRGDKPAALDGFAPPGAVGEIGADG
ncbi:hypothetical protein [Pyrobaculum calidifontis]|nr:hypothetical protein [Pyrobaculum calidifontis]